MEDTDEGTGGRRPDLLLIAAVVTALGAGGLIWWAVRPPPEPPREAAPASETPPSPRPSRTPERDLVAVTEVAVEGTDPAELFGGTPVAPSQTAVDDAVEGSRAQLEDYLEAVFADEGTRFTATPLQDLLGERARAALTPDGERAFGAFGIAAEQSSAAPVEAAATVVGDADGVTLTLLRYEALIDVRTEDGRQGRLTQTAQIAFVPENGDWRADAADVTTTAFPEDLTRPPETATATPGATVAP